MSYSSFVSYKGSTLNSTLGGQIRIEEGRGRMVIYDSDTQRELMVLDRTGLLFDDGTRRRIKLGSYALRVGFWVSKPDVDVIEALGG